MRFKDVFDRIQMHDLCSIFFFRSNCQLRLWNTVLLAGIFCKILWLQAKHSWLHNIHNFSLLSRQSVCIHLRFARISTICSVPGYIRRTNKGNKTKKQTINFNFLYGRYWWATFIYYVVLSLSSVLKRNDLRIAYQKSYEQDLMSLKLWKLRPLKKVVKKKLLAGSWGSFGGVFKFPFTCKMVRPIWCWMESTILGSTGLPEASVTKKVSFAFLPIVDISALLMHKPYSRSILVISERSPKRSSV